jgi:hypothetical protein
MLADCGMTREPHLVSAMLPDDVRSRLLRNLVRDRIAPQKHVWREQIVLLSPEGLGTDAIKCRSLYVV